MKIRKGGEGREDEREEGRKKDGKKGRKQDTGLLSMVAIVSHISNILSMLLHLLGAGRQLVSGCGFSKYQEGRRGKATELLITALGSSSPAPLHSEISLYYRLHDPTAIIQS